MRFEYHPESKNSRFYMVFYKNAETDCVKSEMKEYKKISRKILKLINPYLNKPVFNFAGHLDELSCSLLTLAKRYFKAFSKEKELTVYFKNIPGTHMYTVEIDLKHIGFFKRRLFKISAGRYLSTPREDLFWLNQMSDKNIDKTLAGYTL